MTPAWSCSPPVRARCGLMPPRSAGRTPWRAGAPTWWRRCAPCNRACSASAAPRSASTSNGRTWLCRPSGAPPFPTPAAARSRATWGWTSSWSSAARSMPSPFCACASAIDSPVMPPRWSSTATVARTAAGAATAPSWAGRNRGAYATGRSATRCAARRTSAASPRSAAPCVRSTRASGCSPPTPRRRCWQEQASSSAIPARTSTTRPTCSAARPSCATCRR